MPATLLDAEARRAYRARIADLGDEIAEAEGFNDSGRVARIREEMEMLGGRARCAPAGSADGSARRGRKPSGRV